MTDMPLWSVMTCLIAEKEEKTHIDQDFPRFTLNQHSPLNNIPKIHPEPTLDSP
jgi:hypothetical protein